MLPQTNGGAGKKNRAIKAGYEYCVSTPPHEDDLIKKLKAVSDKWLKVGGHKERTFALGYFDYGYLQNCRLNYLTSGTGQVVAFVNQPPSFTKLNTITVDLMRYDPSAQDPMPYLLYKTIESAKSDGYIYFDLGFVPFAGSKDAVVNLARVFSADRFSAKGLEQFKNKFRPDWQSTYLAYDGDLADLAIIAINLEKAMGSK
jgi:phosphatidylglycerol lysyltransferase